MVGVPAVAPAAQAKPVVLRGTNVLTGDRTTRIAVRVNAPATIDLSLAATSDGLEPKALDARGGRGYVGFLLTERASTAGFFALAVRTPEPTLRGAESVAASAHGQPAVADREIGLSTITGDAPTCEICSIAPGDYDLYLITGGTGASVTVRLGGLSGQRELSPKEHTYSFQWPDRMPLEGPSSASSLGVSGASTSRTFALGWDPDEPGLLLDSYAISVTSRNGFPAAASHVTECRNAGSGNICHTHVLAGASEMIGAFAATQGHFREAGVGTSLQYDITGDARYRFKQDYMWLSVGGAETAGDGGAQSGPLRTQSNHVVH